MIASSPPEKPAPTGVSRFPFPGLLKFFQPVPPASVIISDPAEVKTQFRFWQNRVLLWGIIGYALFYFVRKNLSVAMPFMERDLGITKSDLGLFLTLHGVLYGVSKFANGVLGDRANARLFMVTGLCISALLNVFFGFSSAVIAFGIIWMLNGWFQGMGFPPCARLLTHWFSPNELATKMAIWNTSHCIGGGLIVVLCGYLIKYFGDWRLCFLVPAAIALICVLFLYRNLPDTPASVGLPEAQGSQTLHDSHESFRVILMECVFTNKFIWLVAFANFFVYTLRYAVFDWGPTLLTQAKHLRIEHATWMVFGFEIAGAIGAMLGGWLTDRFFGGRCVRACVIYMVLAGLSILLFWKVAGESKLLNTTLLCAAGFFIYGPQCLVGIAAANMATKRAAATAVGLTGLFGYLSTILSGWGFGALVEHHGWDAGFAGMLIITAIGTIVFAFAWNARAHGYSEPAPSGSLSTPAKF
jgi:phosphoglycerate transporter family protein